MHVFVLFPYLLLFEGEKYEIYIYIIETVFLTYRQLTYRIKKWK